MPNSGNGVTDLNQPIMRSFSYRYALLGVHTKLGARQLKRIPVLGLTCLTMHCVASLMTALEEG